MQTDHAKIFKNDIVTGNQTEGGKKHLILWKKFAL